MGGYLEQKIIPANQSPLSLSDWHRRYLQQAQWTEEIRKHLFSRADLHTSDKILEVGSGTGAILESLLVEGDYSLTGIDIDRNCLCFAQNLENTFNLVQANGYNLPFFDDSFAISFCHYLLLWVEHPGHILGEMRRVTKKGGCVIALAEPDYQSRIDYPPTLDQLGEQQTHSLQAQGADTSMGRKLGMLFNNAGFYKVETGILGAQWKAKEGQQHNEIEWLTIQSDLADQLSNEILLGYQKLDQTARANGERVLFIPTFYAAGVVP
ncbi:MAG: methyltransferase domain-containing protein [Chloroflexota bacterium]|nr:methyltransferase domain-containing protein [Chloroflexota bacterium]